MKVILLAPVEMTQGEALALLIICVLVIVLCLKYILRSS